MKHLQHFICVLSLLFTCVIFAQKSYTVNGASLPLIKEVEGNITLLWNTIDGEYRYFLKKEDAIIELTNTKENKTYKNEFRQTLNTQTSDVDMDENTVKFTLPSLKNYFNAYNLKKDPSFTAAASPLKPALRLGGFAGVTNSHFTDNPTNATQLQLGAELELVDRANLKRHAMLIRLANTFESSDYKYNAFQASLNYRFKFVMQSKLDVYANVKFVSYTTFNSEFIIDQSDATETTVVPTSGDSFDFPVTLGLGADYALGNGYLTLLFDDLVGLNVDGNGEFPLNLQVGYKITL